MEKGCAGKDFEKRMKLLLSGMEFTNGFRRYFFFMLTLLYFISLGHGAAATVAMFAVSKVIVFLLELPTGAFADHFSRKVSIALSFFLMGLSFVGFFSFRSFWLLSASYILSNIGWVFQSGTGTAWIIDSLKYGRKKSKISEILGRFHLFDKTGQVVAGLAGMVIIAFSFRLVWLVVALTNFITTILIIRFMKDNSLRLKNKNGGLMKKTILQMKETVRFMLSKNNRAVRSIFTGVFILVLGLEMYSIILPLILSQRLGFTESQISGIFSLLTAASLAVPFIAMKIIRKHRFRKPMIWIVTAMSLFIAIIGYSELALLSLAALLLCNITDGLIYILTDSCVQHQIPSHSRASLGSLENMIATLAASIASAVVSLGLLVSSLPVIAVTGASIVLVSLAGFMSGMKGR